MTYLIKNKIRLQFDKAAATYDEHCAAQNNICRKSIECLYPFKTNFNHIADLGCGTGESTVNLVQQITFKQCYAVDFAKKLLVVAHKKFSDKSNIQTIEADFEGPLPIPNTLDLIFCNMGLQWSYDMAKTLYLWQSYLNRQGLLLFSMPTSDNFKELAPKYKPKFMAHQQVLTLLSKMRWELLSEKTLGITQPFTDSLSALKSLKATGTNHNKGVYQRQGLSLIKPHHVFTNPKDCTLTYHVGIYLVRKIP